MTTVSISGGLDVESIVGQLMYVERAPARSLEAQRQGVKARLAALDRFESNLQTLQATADGIRGPNDLESRSAGSSEPNTVTATAQAGAQVGAYRVGVSQLAATHNLASTTFASLSDTLTNGTFDLQVGNGETFSINVGAGSDTLEGLRDAIQNSGAGVSASVLYDGSNYRLSIRSGQSGTRGAITIGNFSDPGLGLDLGLTTTVAAANARFTVNGIDMTRSSNTVTDAVAGLTLNLGADNQPESTVTVAADPEQGFDAITKFVDQYNRLFTEAKAELRRPGSTPGLLAQMSSVSRILDKLRTTLSRSVPGLDGETQTLRQAGIAFENDGTITVDAAKLRGAIDSGAASDLFGVSGRASDTRVRYAGSGRETQSGSYGVYVSRAAEQATVTATEDLGAGLANDETLTFTQGDLSVDVHLTSGQTTSQVIDTINSGLDGSGLNLVAADGGSGRVKLTSREFGSSAAIDVRSDQDGAGTTGFGTAGMQDSGVDVAGTIDGQAATGAGRRLTSGTGDAKGLAVDVRATAADIGGGTSLGTATFSVGVGEAVHRALTTTLSSQSGAVALERTGLNDRDKILKDRISTIDRRLEKRSVGLTRQLARADIALQQMSSLTQQIQSQLGQLGG